LEKRGKNLRINHSRPHRENRRNAGLGYVDVLTTPAHVEKQYPVPAHSRASRLYSRPQGKTPNRDSINAKVFGKGGMGFGEGREKLSSEKFSLPSPMLLFPALLQLHLAHRDAEGVGNALAVSGIGLGAVVDVA